VFEDSITHNPVLRSTNLKRVLYKEPFMTELLIVRKRLRRNIKVHECFYPMRIIQAEAVNLRVNPTLLYFCAVLEEFSRTPGDSMRRNTPRQ